MSIRVSNAPKRPGSYVRSKSVGYVSLMHPLRSPVWSSLRERERASRERAKTHLRHFNLEPSCTTRVLGIAATDRAHAVYSNLAVQGEGDEACISSSSVTALDMWRGSLRLVLHCSAANLLVLERLTKRSQPVLRSSLDQEREYLFQEAHIDATPEPHHRSPLQMQ